MNNIRSRATAIVNSEVISCFQADVPNEVENISATTTTEEIQEITQEIPLADGDTLEHNADNVPGIGDVEKEEITSLVATKSTTEIAEITTK
ncbi:hypothetical protein [Anaerostipes sp.]|uniref:hypothetical protein n=1 Tax=Anaerostipes sp. TaxID=1872530 RepID=UPI0025C315F0|nr:hypothetical protein [Anaerostipes sp.]